MIPPGMSPSRVAFVESFVDFFFEMEMKEFISSELFFSFMDIRVPFLFDC